MFIGGILVWMNFHLYVALAAMEHWGWIESNIFDEIFGWWWMFIDSNFIVGFMVWPTKELMGTFLDLDEDDKFDPLNEW